MPSPRFFVTTKRATSTCEFGKRTVRSTFFVARRWPIFLGRIARPLRGSIGSAVDNANLAAALKGHSRNVKVLRDQYRDLWQAQAALNVALVPSARQLADAPSRGRQLPQDTQRFFEGPRLRQLPVWRPPSFANTAQEIVTPAAVEAYSKPPSNVAM